MQILMILLVIVIFVFSCENESNKLIKLTDDEEKHYSQKAELIIKESFDSLLTNTSRAIKETGIKGALKYCNLNSYPIIYHLEKKNNVKIKRTSVKFRNPANQPDSLEKSVLDNYENLIKQGKNLKAALKVHNNHIHYFKPIIVQDVCLKCHGSIGEELKSVDHHTISELYPADNATGFKTGDLRGMWHLVLK